MYPYLKIVNTMRCGAEANLKFKMVAQATTDREGDDGLYNTPYVLHSLYTELHMSRNSMRRDCKVLRL